MIGRNEKRGTPEEIPLNANELNAVDRADYERRGYVEAARLDTLPHVPILASRSLVYGEHPVGQQLLFIPDKRARFLAQVWRALVKSKTWNDLKRLAPAAAYREIRGHNKDNLDPHELRADTPFDYYEMTGVPDGDYPGWPAQEMFGWMPLDIQLDFGSTEGSRLNGECLIFRPNDTKAIVERLKRAGFRCRRNQRLVERAHGD
jgi:hypothetical protein